MRTALIILSGVMLLICTGIASFIAGAIYEKEYEERKKLDKVINCLNKEDLNHEDK